MCLLRMKAHHGPGNPAVLPRVLGCLAGQPGWWEISEAPKHVKVTMEWPIMQLLFAATSAICSESHGLLARVPQLQHKLTMCVAWICAHYSLCVLGDKEHSITMFTQRCCYYCNILSSLVRVSGFPVSVHVTNLLACKWDRTSDLHKEQSSQLHSMSFERAQRTFLSPRLFGEESIRVLGRLCLGSSLQNRNR